jgi:hypothetical protein
MELLLNVKLLKLNSKKFFSHLDKKLNSHSSIPNLRNQNTLIVNDLDKANEFLQTFKASFTADNNIPGDLPAEAYFPPTDIIPDFSLSSVSKHLKNINSASAAGPDALPVNFGTICIRRLPYPSL